MSLRMIALCVLVFAALCLKVESAMDEALSNQDVLGLLNSWELGEVFGAEFERRNYNGYTT